MFGTDGIRGKYGVSPITPADFTLLGKAIGYVVQAGNEIYIGHDGRTSHQVLQSALTDALLANGIHVKHCGLLPTPALAKLAEQDKVHAAMITASHNPASDNGIKLFTPEGIKWDNKLQDKLAQALEKTYYTGPSGSVTTYEAQATSRYIDYISTTHMGTDLTGLRIAIDCANGATSKLAQKLYHKTGAHISCYHTSSGACINKACGSTQPESMIAVVQQGFDCALAFDGDGDRLVAIDETGTVLDGDDILYILATQNNKKIDKVVTSVMSNAGLEQALQEKNIATQKVKVGDKHIYQALEEQQLTLGAEPSGHILYLPYAKSGDGLLAGLMLLQAMKSTGKKLSQLRSCWQRYPQRLVNLPQKCTNKTDSWVDYVSQIQTQNQAVNIILRASQTEPLWRLKVEAHSLDIVNKTMEQLVTQYHRIMQ